MDAYQGLYYSLVEAQKNNEPARIRAVITNHMDDLWDRLDEGERELVRRFVINEEMRREDNA